MLTHRERIRRARHFVELLRDDCRSHDKARTATQACHCHEYHFLCADIAFNQHKQRPEQGREAEA